MSTGALMGAGAAGGIISSYGALQEGEAGYAAANYNAQVAEQNAAQSRAQGIENERRSRIESRKAIGSLKTAYSASGVSMSGSALDVLAESVANAELDARTIKQASEARAINFENEAKVQRYAGGQARLGGRIKSAAALLGAGGSMAKAFG